MVLLLCIASVNDVAAHLPLLKFQSFRIAYAISEVTVGSCCVLRPSLIEMLSMFTI